MILKLGNVARKCVSAAKYVAGRDYTQAHELVHQARMVLQDVHTALGKQRTAPAGHRWATKHEQGTGWCIAGGHITNTPGVGDTGVVWPRFTSGGRPYGRVVKCDDF